MGTDIFIRALWYLSIRFNFVGTTTFILGDKVLVTA